jgi:Domain of unknown function (DUF4267)
VALGSFAVAALLDGHMTILALLDYRALIVLALLLNLSVANIPSFNSTEEKVMSLIAIASGLAVLVSVGIIIIGATYLLIPQASAARFGLPVWPHGTDGWLNLKGIRDIVSGLVLLVPLVLGQSQVLGWLLLAAAVTPIGDMLVVLRYKGSKALAYGMHGGTAAGVIAIAILLITS